MVMGTRSSPQKPVTQGAAPPKTLTSASLTFSQAFLPEGQTDPVQELVDAAAQVTAVTGDASTAPIPVVEDGAAGPTSAAVVVPVPEVPDPPLPKPAAKDTPKKNKKKTPDANELEFELAGFLEETNKTIPYNLLKLDEMMEHGQTRLIKNSKVSFKITDLTSSPPVGLIGPLVVYGDAAGGGYWILGGQHIFTAANNMGKVRAEAGMPRLPWQELFTCHVVRCGTSVDRRELIAGKHQTGQVRIHAYTLSYRILTILLPTRDTCRRGLAVRCRCRTLPFHAKWRGLAVCYIVSGEASPSEGWRSAC